MADAMEDLLRNIVRTEVAAVIGNAPPRKAWTVHEVAVSVGVSDSTVRAWIRDRKLRAFHDGSITRIAAGVLFGRPAVIGLSAIMLLLVVVGAASDAWYALHDRHTAERRWRDWHRADRDGGRG